MNIYDALVDVLGINVDGYEWLLYAAAIVFFMLFMDWTFNLISVLIFNWFSDRRR